MLDNPKEDYNERVLGMQWNPKNDVSKFSKKKEGSSYFSRLISRAIEH